MKRFGILALVLGLLSILVSDSSAGIFGRRRGGSGGGCSSGTCGTPGSACASGNANLQPASADAAVAVPTAIVAPLSGRAVAKSRVATGSLLAPSAARQAERSTARAIRKAARAQSLRTRTRTRASASSVSGMPIRHDFLAAAEAIPEPAVVVVVPTGIVRASITVE